MTNLVFDLSNMFFRSMHIVGGIYTGNAYTFDNQDELDQLMRKLSTDVSYIIRQLGSSRVILTMDSKSWRKNIEIEENEGYKANRDKSESINWDNIYACMDEFAAILESKGSITSKIDSAEADDLMCLWRDELLFEKGEHVILVSGDKDIKQLAARNGDKFACIYNPFKQGKNPKKLFTPSGFQTWLMTEDEGSFFNMSIDVDRDSFKKLINDGIVLNEINPKDIVLDKVFCGDDGDNIPSIHTWIGKDSNGNNKTYRITPSKYKKIMKLISKTESYDDVDNNTLKNEETLEIIKDFLVKESKKPLPFNIKDRVNRQINLVYLERTEIPGDIIDIFNDSIIGIENAKVNSSNWNMHTILEGTRYVNTKTAKIKSEAFIFKDLDNIIKSKNLF